MVDSQSDGKTNDESLGEGTVGKDTIARGDIGVINEME